MKIAVVIPNYNSARIVQRAVEAMQRQRVPAGHSVQVVVADDGSTDGSADALASRFGDSITLLRQPENRGRSTTRNAGAAASDADILVFVDSDCVPVDVDFLAKHAAAMQAGADVVFGEVCTPGPGFWDRLQRDASDWRRRRFDEGESWTFTTQNVAIRRDRFEATGGFDPAFDRHGFEDRDLFIRLAQSGAKVHYEPSAAVLHEDRISLASVARKLGDAGYHAAHLFAAKHPDTYPRIAFSRIDASRRPWLAWVDLLAWPIARQFAFGPAGWLEWNVLPFRLRAFLARSLYGLSFLHGTVRRRRETRA